MIECIATLLAELSLIDLFLGSSPEARSNLRALKQLMPEEDFTQAVESVYNNINPNTLPPQVEIRLNLERRDQSALLRNLIQFEAHKIIELMQSLKQNKAIVSDSELGELIRNIWKDAQIVEQMRSQNYTEAQAAITLKNIKEIILGFSPKKNASECCVQMRNTNYQALFRPEELDQYLSLDLFYAIVWHHLVMIKAFLQNPGRSGGTYSEGRIRKQLSEEFSDITNFYRHLNNQVSIQSTLQVQSIRSEIAILIESIKGLL